MLRHFPRMQVSKKAKVFSCTEIVPRGFQYLEVLSGYKQTFGAIYQQFRVMTSTQIM